MPHTAENCEDTLAGRTGLARACFCQHKPYSAAVPRQSAGSGGGGAGTGIRRTGDPPRIPRLSGLARKLRTSRGRQHHEFVDLFAGRGGSGQLGEAGMSTEDTYEEATHEVDVEEPIEVGDLLDDPRTDVEALCLCALLWSATDVAGHVSDLLNGTDFDRGVYGELFEVITGQVRTGAPHDPASIASRLTQSGRAGGHRGTQLTRALSEATIAVAAPSAVGHYAVAVLSGAYRRGFHVAAQSMTQAAEQLPEDQLFAHLLSIGRAQRAATERLHHAQTSLSSTHRASASPNPARNTEPTTSEGSPAP